MRAHKTSGFLAETTVQKILGLKGRRPTMTQFDGELSPPFEIVEPAHWRAPIIFNSPHSRPGYPLGFFNPPRLGLAAPRRPPGSFTDELIGDPGEQGLPNGRGNFPPPQSDA